MKINVKKLDKATLYSCINSEMSSKGQTIWGLHNGVTYWTNHHKSHPVRENGQIESLMVGTNYTTNMKSMEFCMKEVGLSLAE